VVFPHARTAQHAGRGSGYLRRAGAAQSGVKVTRRRWISKAIRALLLQHDTDLGKEKDKVDAFVCLEAQLERGSCRRADS